MVLVSLLIVMAMVTTVVLMSLLIVMPTVTLVSLLIVMAIRCPFCDEIDLADDAGADESIDLPRHIFGSFLGGRGLRVVDRLSSRFFAHATARKPVSK